MKPVASAASFHRFSTQLSPRVHCSFWVALTEHATLVHLISCASKKKKKDTRVFFFFVCFADPVGFVVSPVVNVC